MFSRVQSPTWALEGGGWKHRHLPELGSAAGVAYGFLGSVEDPSERVQLSLLFACHPNTENLRGLQKFNVTWFLAYRNKIDPTVWSEVGKVRFSNAHYAVIELN